MSSKIMAQNSYWHSCFGKASTRAHSNRKSLSSALNTQTGNLIKLQWILAEPLDGSRALMLLSLWPVYFSWMNNDKSMNNRAERPAIMTKSKKLGSTARGKVWTDSSVGSHWPWLYTVQWGWAARTAADSQTRWRSRGSLLSTRCSWASPRLALGEPGFYPVGTKRRTAGCKIRRETHQWPHEDRQFPQPTITSVPPKYTEN